MSTYSPTIALGLLVLAAAHSVADERPGLGVPVTEAEVAAVDLVIMPDGRGLPAGSGNAHQGLVVYQRECRVCHGDGGQGGPNDRLTGGVGSIVTDQPVKTTGSYWPYATTIFDYVQRAMPYHLPGSLSADDTYAVAAYLLAESGVIEKDEVMDAQSLPAVRMPNRDGFRWSWPTD